MSKKTKQQATPEQMTEVRRLVNELGDKSFSAGFAEGREEGYAEGYSDGFDEGKPANPEQTGTPTPAALDKDHGSELVDYNQVPDDFSMAEEICCEHEQKINEVMSAVRALLINGADNVHIEHTVLGDFNVISDQCV